MVPQRMSRPPCPQIKIVGECLMSIAFGNLDARSGERVSPARLDEGRDECILLSFSGRRKARTKVDRSTSVSSDCETFTGMEGKYLKLGKRKAEDMKDDDASAAGGKDEFVTRMLLYGCRKLLTTLYAVLEETDSIHTSEYFPPRPNSAFSPRTSPPQPSPSPSFSMRLVQSSFPVHTRICWA